MVIGRRARGKALIPDERGRMSRSLTVMRIQVSEPVTINSGSVLSG